MKNLWRFIGKERKPMEKEKNRKPECDCEEEDMERAIIVLRKALEAYPGRVEE